jgi:hypothetical protein
MWKPISARVESAFGRDVADQDVATFLTELRANRREIVVQQRRTAWLIVLLVAILLLIGQGQVSHASVLFVQIESLTLVGLAIPPAVGYLLVNQFLLLLDENYASELHDGILRLKQPGITQENLQLMIAPPTSAWCQGSKLSLLYGKGGRRSDAMGVVIGLFTTSLTIILSTAVNALLLYELVNIYGWRHFGAWISAATVVGEWIFFNLLFTETKWPWDVITVPPRA